MEIITKSQSETIEFAKKYGQSLKSGDVVLLNGEMGAGKTVFTKGIALALGITSEITSPTYAYLNDYDESFIITIVIVCPRARTRKLWGLPNIFTHTASALSSGAKTSATCFPIIVKR